MTAWLAVGLAVAGPETSPDAVARMLDMDPVFLREIQVGLEQIYERRYDEALSHFVEVEQSFPDTGLGAVSETVIWQARMLENFDYRHEKAYWSASKRARKQLDVALGIEGNEAWENLASAAIVGMESIHSFRQHKYLNAVSLAFTAMGHIESSRTAAPDLVDLRLADGMYLYWRTIITERSSMIPDFGDHKAEGIAAMEAVEQNGVFIRPLATLALAFTFLEDGQSERALAACERNRARYPDNVINNLVLTMSQVKQKKYDEAISTLDRVRATDPTNAYSQYWRGVTQLKQKRYAEAKASFEGFLGTEHLEKYQRAAAHWRLGMLYERQKDYPTAVDAYQRAVKINSHKPSKQRLERLKARKKSGELDY
ncbi:MAG: tetratricopeptide repeat protein [Myxococcota bacterium]